MELMELLHINTAVDVARASGDQSLRWWWSGAALHRNFYRIEKIHFFVAAFSLPYMKGKSTIIITIIMLFRTLTRHQFQ